MSKDDMKKIALSVAGIVAGAYTVKYLKKWKML